MTDPDVQHFSSVFPKMPCLSGGGLTQILCVMSCHDLGQLLSYHAPDFAHHDIFPYTCSFLLQANQIGHLICACCHMTLMFAHGAQSVKCAVCNHVTPVNMSSVIQLSSSRGRICNVITLPSISSFLLSSHRKPSPDQGLQVHGALDEVIITDDHLHAGDILLAQSQHQCWLCMTHWKHLDILPGMDIQNIPFLGKFDFECSSAGTSNGGLGAQPCGVPQCPISTQSVIVENHPSLDQDGNEVGLTISGKDPALAVW